MLIHSQKQSSIKLPNQVTEYIVGTDLLSNLDSIPMLQKYDTFLIFSDETVYKLYGDAVTYSLRKYGKPVIRSIIPSGEKHKSMAEIAHIIKPFFEHTFTRNTALISFGGGVVTDIGGFIGSILLRGIPTIHIPTTLLGQIDASIGGKSGVDVWTEETMYKNMIGIIKQPDIIISDTNVLQSLPTKEIQNGLGEMVKYWVGWGKPSIHALHEVKNNHVTHEIINECQQIKINVIEQDPLDTTGIREQLNLGHTIGHAIEGTFNGSLSHGECVAMGLVIEARLSFLKGILKETVYKTIYSTVQSLNLPVQLPSTSIEKIKSVMKMDKKGGTFALVEDIGKLVTKQTVVPQLIDQALSEFIL